MTGLRSWMYLLITVACGGPSGPKLPTPHHVTASAIDVDSQNLGPKEEIDALLQGMPQLGRTTDVAHVAVPPLVVVGGGGDQWLGEAAADMIMSELSTARGVVAVARGELLPIISELARKGSDDVTVIATGR